MARIRTIKPEFWTDEDMAELSEPACLLAIGLLNYADDEGYFNANPKLIKAAVFPIREPSVPIPVLIQELSNCGYLSMFSTSDGKQFGAITNFLKHQVVNKPKESKIRCLHLIPYEYGTDTGQVPLGMDQGSGIRESKTLSLRAKKFKSLPLLFQVSGNRSANSPCMKTGNRQMTLSCAPGCGAMHYLLTGTRNQT